MSTKTLMTCQEFERLAMSEKLGPCELIDGEVIPLSPGGFKHSKVSLRIGVILDRFIHGKSIGHVLGNEVGMHVRQDPPRSRGADVAFISYKRLPKGQLSDGFLTVAPELTVEVIGQHNAWGDMEEKIKDYHTFGVDMVWVADPNTRTVKQYPRDGEPTILHDGQQIGGGTVLPGFKASVAEFFDE